MLTVVIPCYDSAATIDACLDSVLSYPGPDIEVIAVDDGSADATVRTLTARAETDSRLRVHRMPERSGPGPARNAGMAAATGDYLWFVDADDLVPPGAVEAILADLRSHRPELLLVDHAEFTEEQGHDRSVARRTADRIGPLPSEVRLTERPDLLRLAQSPCTKIVQRSLLDRAGLRFPPGRYEDAYYNPLLLMATTTIRVLPRICYLYRQGRAGSTTSTPGPWHFEIFDQYDRLFAALAAGPAQHERFRPEVYRVMLDHYLVVLGHEGRLRDNERRRFFRRVVADAARFRPATGYPRPAGVAGLKHTLVGVGAYPPYALLRTAYRLARRA